MSAPSGLYRAGTVLLLVGAILGLVGAVFMVGFGAFFVVLDAVADPDDEASGAFAVIMAVVYGGIGLLLGVGAIFGFLAHGHAKRGEAHQAWVKGLVCSLLPPLQVIPLLGAIFCLVSPEGEAAKARGGA